MLKYPKPKHQVLSDQQGGGGVAEVGCGPRGRPVSLGAYDNLVQVGFSFFLFILVSACMITSCRWGPDRVKFFLWLAGPSKHIVQEAIKQLQERGEKVTAFVVIAVAKQVAPVLQIDVGSESDIMLFDIYVLKILRRDGIPFLSGMFHCH